MLDGCEEESSFRELLWKEALKYVGYPSVGYDGVEIGLDPEKGFNCSGFVTFLLRALSHIKIVKFKIHPVFNRR
jgi:hypothetical protein